MSGSNCIEGLYDTFCRIYSKLTNREECCEYCAAADDILEKSEDIETIDIEDVETIERNVDHVEDQDERDVGVEIGELIGEQTGEDIGEEIGEQDEEDKEETGGLWTWFAGLWGVSKNDPWCENPSCIECNPLSIDDIKTIEELNTQLKQIEDDTAQAILEIDWYMKLYNSEHGIDPEASNENEAASDIK